MNAKPQRKPTDRPVEIDDDKLDFAAGAEQIAVDTNLASRPGVGILKSTDSGRTW